MQLNLRPHLSLDSIKPRPPIRFQILAIEVCDKPHQTIDISHVELLTSDSMYSEEEERESSHDKASNLCEVDIFGISGTGNSIAIRVTGFRPHFYVELTPIITTEVITGVITGLKNRYGLGTNAIQFCTVYKKRAYGWVPDENDSSKVRRFKFACITFPNCWLLRVMARIFAEKSTSRLRNLNETADVSEDKVAPSEKFLALHNLKPSAWAQIDAKAYTLVPQEKRISISQLEAKTSVGILKPLERQTIAPIVIAAVDIEAHSHDFRSFPDVNHPGDKVTFIGTTFWVYGDTEPRARVMQVLGECDSPEPQIHVQSFRTEYDLLMGWRDLIAIHGDPDFMVSYNGTGFDYAYLSGRMNLVCTQRNQFSSRFNFMGRILQTPNPLKVRELTSAAKGQNIISWFPQPGRIQMDLFMYVKDSQKLSSYKLDDVCDAFLKDSSKVVLDYPDWVKGSLETARNGLIEMYMGESPQEITHLMDQSIQDCPQTGDYTQCHKFLDLAVHKVKQSLEGAGAATMNRAQHIMDSQVQPALDASGDNNYRKLFRLYEVGPGPRGAIATYCQVDCDLVVKLLDRLNVIANTFQMSQVCNTLADDVCNRGQQIKTFNLISRFATGRGYVMNRRETGWDPDATYEGATVLEPTPGYYQTPVATLDFASLYPSLMRGFNLCPSSLVLDPEYTTLPDVKYGKYDIGGKTWVFQESTKGLLPDILGSLLDARRAKKREMKKYPKGSLDHRLCDGAQLALKMSCNSVYGFCGVINNGMFPCLPVAVATTYNGRKAISQTKEFVQEKFNATVIYGDTDSVMLTFPGIHNVPDAFELAERVATETTAIFPDTVVLEFEKVFYPYLLIKRKTYSGVKYEDDPHAPPTLDVKGLAVVRRDNCELVRDVMKQVLNLTMQDNNPQEAYNVVERAVRGVVKGEIPLSKLQITNSLKSDESYANDAQPQLVVVKKMRARKAFDVPRSGDRVPFVITENPSLPRVSDRAEHPRYMEEHPEIRPDSEYYLTKQLEKRLEGILELLPVPNVGMLFEGALEQIKSRGIDAESIHKVVKMNTVSPKINNMTLPPARPKKRKPTPKKTVPTMSVFGAVNMVKRTSQSRIKLPPPGPKKRKTIKQEDVDKEFKPLF